MPPPPPPANQSCFGLDVNRNWDYEWDGNPEGASTNPCSQTVSLPGLERCYNSFLIQHPIGDDALLTNLQPQYKGESPSSSPENQALTKLVNELRDSSGIVLYVSLRNHHYSSLTQPSQ